MTALLRGLPKELRRPLAPVPDTAARVTAALRPRKGRLVDQVAALLGRRRAPSTRRAAAAPADALRGRATARRSWRSGTTSRRCRPRCGRCCARRCGPRAGVERSGLRDWPCDRSPDGSSCRAWSASRRWSMRGDRGRAGVRVDSRPRRRRTARGCAGCCCSRCPRRRRPRDLIFATADPGLLDDIAAAVADGCIGELSGTPTRWRRRCAATPPGAGRPRSRAHAARRRTCCARPRDVRATMERRGGDALRETRLDVARQLGRLLRAGLRPRGRRGAAARPRALPAGRRAAARARAGRARPDRDRMATLAELEALGPDPLAAGGAARLVLRSSAGQSRGSRRKQVRRPSRPGASLPALRKNSRVPVGLTARERGTQFVGANRRHRAA